MKCGSSRQFLSLTHPPTHTPPLLLFGCRCRWSAFFDGVFHQQQQQQTTGISYGVFQAWYESSLFWTEQKVAAGNQAQQEEGDQESLWDGLRAGECEKQVKTIDGG